MQELGFMRSCFLEAVVSSEMQRLLLTSELNKCCDSEASACHGGKIPGSTCEIS